MSKYAADDFAHIKRKMEERHAEEARVLNGGSEPLTVEQIERAREALDGAGIPPLPQVTNSPDHGDVNPIDGTIWDSIDSDWCMREEFYKRERARIYNRVKPHADDEPCAQCGGDSDYDDENEDPICEQCDKDEPKGTYWMQESGGAKI